MKSFEQNFTNNGNKEYDDMPDTILVDAGGEKMKNYSNKRTEFGSNFASSVVCLIAGIAFLIWGFSRGQSALGSHYDNIAIGSICFGLFFLAAGGYNIYKTIISASEKDGR